MPKSDEQELTNEQLLQSLERVREQVAVLKRRLEQIRNEQRRLKRHVQFQKWQKDQKLVRDQVIQESLAEITYLQTLKTPEAVWEIDAKLMDLKLKISEYASEAKMTFD